MVKFPFFVAGQAIMVGVRRRDVKRMYYALFNPKRNLLLRFLHKIFKRKPK